MSFCHNNQRVFENYIVSDCNEEAYTLCRSVVSTTEGKFVGIYGPSPCGKTHLLNAVKSEYIRNYPTRRVMSYTFEELTSQYIDAIKKENILGFREYIRDYDLILIDNMQFADGKSTTQEEFAHCFFAMLDSCKSIIVAWDGVQSCLDVLLRKMSERYPDRCHIAKMSEPDVVLRETYFKTLSEDYNLSIPDTVIFEVINSREIPFSAIGGYLITIKALEEQNGKMLTEQEMMKLLNDYRREES